MPHVFITGANRGLGFEHARQYAEQGWRVTATARRPDQAAELNELADRRQAAIRVVRLDVTDAAAVDSLAAEMGGERIDVLINNAGTFGPQGAPEGMAYQSLTNMDYDIWREILEINLLAPFRIAVAFRPHLEAGDPRLLVMMTSHLGSMAGNTMGGAYAYRSSKAGLNMLTKGMAIESPRLIVVAMAPGWCRTDLGGAEAPIDPADSVRGQQATFARLGPADSGRCIDVDGTTVPW